MDYKLSNVLEESGQQNERRIRKERTIEWNEDGYHVDPSAVFDNGRVNFSLPHQQKSIIMRVLLQNRSKVMAYCYKKRLWNYKTAQHSIIVY